MIETPMDVLHQLQAIRTQKQIQAFRDSVQSYATGLGYKTSVEKGSWGCRNIIIGDPETASYLIASCIQSSSGLVTLLETAASMPHNLRDRVCFLLYDGSACGIPLHRRNHVHALALQTVLDLDSVGVGDSIIIIPNAGLKADEERLQQLIDLERRFGTKRIQVRDRGITLFPFDGLSFPRGAVVCAVRKNKLGYLCARIPTLRDKLPDYTNVNIYQL